MGGALYVVRSFQTRHFFFLRQVRLYIVDRNVNPRTVLLGITKEGFDGMTLYDINIFLDTDNLYVYRSVVYL